jgi:hypothetical protein
MAGDHVFGSDELTPELLRSVQFTEHDGRYDAADVRTFLERAASALEVFLSADAPSALRAEFKRNADIAQQVLDAGQNASAQLRRQAAEDARAMLEETREATTSLRESVERELGASREQVEGMRAQFIQDLRDLYDRVGASLYRFERSTDEQHTSTLSAMGEAPVDQVQAHGNEHVVHELLPSYELPPELDYEPALAPVPHTLEPEPQHQPQQPPAWQQLPPEAWSPDPVQHDPAERPVTIEPFEVVEDEPLAPGEPLVDLREFSETHPDETTTIAASFEPPPGPAPEPVAEASGSWLDEPLAARSESAPEPPHVPDLAHDDALAEALIAGSPFADAAPVHEQPAAPTIGNASPDAVAVRQLILDSLAAGQTREAVESYLRDQLGMLEPGALVDAALTSSG